MGFLRDVAAFRQRKQAFFALNFRNVIEIKPLLGFFGTKRTIIFQIRDGLWLLPFQGGKSYVLRSQCVAFGFERVGLAGRKGENDVPKSG